MNEQKRLNWFMKGSDGLARAFPDFFPGDHPFYVCPLCRAIYTIEGVYQRDLTIEHVPPKSLRGKGLVLTCKDCNQKWGALAVPHARWYEDGLEFQEGALRRSKVPGKLIIEGLEINLDVAQSENGILFRALDSPQGNSPQSIEQLSDYLESFSNTSGMTMRFQLSRRFVPRLARISWLCSAYLAAFALLGYSYIFSSYLSEVRRQLDNPQETVLRGFVKLHPSKNPHLRRVGLVVSPEDCTSLVLVMGRHAVFLPLPTSPPNVYENLQAIGNDPALLAVDTSFSWPHEPLHLLDRGLV